MKKSVLLMVVIGIAVLGALSCAKTEPVAETEMMVEAEPVAEEMAAEARHDMVYACNCGPECDCGSISAEPGSCSCGGDLAPAHMLKVDGHDATICSCGEGCECELSAEDETKCSCGADVRTVSLEGKGLYFCNCGGSCTCNYVSTEPGNCACGMELVS